MPHIYTPLRTSRSRIGVGRVRGRSFTLAMLACYSPSLYVLSLRYVQTPLLSFHFVWTFGVFENLLRTFLDCVSVCISAPTITGASSLVSRRSLKWRQALASQSRPLARSRYAHAHRALRHALRRPPAQCRSPARHRRHYMPPPRTAARINMCADAHLPYATDGARTRASPLVSSPRRPPTWWSTHPGSL